MAAEYQEHFGEHAYDDEGNFVGGESSEGQEAWADMFTEAEATGETVEVDLSADDAAEAVEVDPSADDAVEAVETETTGV